MKLWDGSYLSTRGVVAIVVTAEGNAVVHYENTTEWKVPMHPKGREAYLEQIETFAKEAGL